MFNLTRRALIASAATVALAASFATSAAANDLTFTLATSGSETDQRSVAMAEVFAPMVSDFADYQPGIMGLFSLRVPS